MRLADLEPKWLSDNMFVFLCPHCLVRWLSCKDIIMSHEDQMTLFQKDGVEWVVVPCKPEFAWKFVGHDFATISVTPSLDASAAGDWHGHITNGEIVGGEQCLRL